MHGVVSHLEWWISVSVYPRRVLSIIGSLRDDGNSERPFPRKVPQAPPQTFFIKKKTRVLRFDCRSSSNWFQGSRFSTHWRLEHDKLLASVAVRRDQRVRMSFVDLVRQVLATSVVFRKEQ
jgi:hypothetical protein